MIEKFDPEMVLSAVHFEGKAKNFFVKRFVPDNVTVGKKVSFISDETGSKLVLISVDEQPMISLTVLKGRAKEKEQSEINLSEFIDVKGLKANGNRLSQFEIVQVELLAPIVSDEEEEGEESSDSDATESNDEATNDIQTPSKKIEFEITNPDDTDLEDDGQYGLFKE
ncbi:DNA topoisomerase IV subunit A [compost metagenome]